MRALVITEHGPPDVLRVQDRPDPEPGPGEARVRVRAAGINFEPSAVSSAFAERRHGPAAKIVPSLVRELLR